MSLEKPKCDTQTNTLPQHHVDYMCDHTADLVLTQTAWQKVMAAYRQVDDL